MMKNEEDDFILRPMEDENKQRRETTKRERERDERALLDREG